MSGGIHINESPGAVGFVQRIFVGLTKEMKLWKAFLKILESLRIVSGLVEIKANGPGILIAAPDRFIFALTLALDSKVGNHRG